MTKFVQYSFDDVLPDGQRVNYYLRLMTIRLPAMSAPLPKTQRNNNTKIINADPLNSGVSGCACACGVRIQDMSIALRERRKS